VRYQHGGSSVNFIGSECHDLDSRQQALLMLHRAKQEFWQKILTKTAKLPKCKMVFRLALGEVPATQ
jgi:hypothetical protein